LPFAIKLREVIFPPYFLLDDFDEGFFDATNKPIEAMIAILRAKRRTFMLFVLVCK